MNIDVSPDGEKLIFDLLGDIYQLAIDGGVAEPITSGRSWDQAPRYSPDGEQIYFVSDRKGFKNIWRLTLANKTLDQVTQADSHILGGPNWSRGGNHLIAGLGDAETGNSEIILHSIDSATGKMTPIDPPNGPWFDSNSFEVFRSAIRVYSAAQSSDGDTYYSQSQRDQEMGRTTVRLFAFNVNTKNRTAITPSDASFDEYKPQLSVDSRLLAYFRQYNDRRTELRIRERSTGEDKALIELENADDASYTPRDDSRPNYAFTPDGRHVIFWHGGRIHRVSLADGVQDIIPFRVTVEREVWDRAQPPAGRIEDTGQAKIVRWPSLSEDGRTMVFAAIGYIWVMDFVEGQLRRLTDSTAFEFMPAISPDGQSVAYVSYAETGDGDWISNLVVARTDGGTPMSVLAKPKHSYLLPQWSQDGQKIALIREVDGENGIEAHFGWTPRGSGVFHSVSKAPASGKPLTWFIYARYVGFDITGENLLFSYPRSRSEVVLASARLDGSELKTLAVGTSEVDGITPDPNLSNLALTREDGSVWITSFDASLNQNQVSTASPAAYRVSVGGGYYANWSHRGQLTYGFGQNVYRFQPGSEKHQSIRVNVPFTKNKTPQPIAFTGARLITITGESGVGTVIDSGTVVLHGQRISAVGKIDEVEIPANAIVIDAEGKTIMPGLSDVHYHSIGGHGLSAFKLPNANLSDNSAIAYGVTTAWEPGGTPNDGSPATADFQSAGRILGPRWSHAATGSVGYPWEQLTTQATAIAAVTQHKELGVAIIKEYNTPTRHQQQWLSAAAHQEGMGVVSHIQSFDGMMTRIVDGYTGGDHPYVPVPFFDDVRELLVQSGYIWTPNILIADGSVGDFEGKKQHLWRIILNKHPLERDKLNVVAPFSRIGKEDATTRPSAPLEVYRVSRVAKQVAQTARDGVRIGVSAHNTPGSEMHREMWFLWKGGMPVEDVLRAATVVNAEKLGLQEEIGSLEPGKMADFLVLDENPLDDILNTLSLKYTVQGGRVYNSTTAERIDVSTIAESSGMQAANDAEGSVEKTGTDD